MSANNTFLAMFLGSKTTPLMTAWNALPEAERLAKQKEGIAAWKAWAEKHQAAIVGMGGPLGKTKKVSQRGIEDTSNEMGAYMVVRADSHEAAAKLFGDTLERQLLILSNQGIKELLQARYKKFRHMCQFFDLGA